MLADIFVFIPVILLVSLQIIRRLYSIYFGQRNLLSTSGRVHYPAIMYSKVPTKGVNNVFLLYLFIGLKGIESLLPL